jgi:hypothetical protein
MTTNRMVMGMLAGALMLTGLLLFTANPAKAESHFSIGIGVGPGYYAPPPVVYRSPYPGPGYYWIDGYYDPYNAWIPGYWAAPYARSYGYGYVAPRSYGNSYYGGYRRGFDRDDFRRGWGRGREEREEHEHGRGWGRR